MWQDLCVSHVEKVVVVGGFSGQSEDSCFTVKCWWCGKNRELVDRSGAQATEDCP